ncbi:MAG: AbrB/MazE/SpoVT family DNA-binding domain-containing protein [bacterium]
MLITLKERGTFTVSKELRQKLGISPGDTLEARVENGCLILIPIVAVPRVATLSDSGRKKNAEAEKDIKHGRVKVFKTAKDLVRDLNEDSED